MKASTKKAQQGMILTLPLAVGCLVFYAIPFIMVIQYSLTRGVGSSQIFVGIYNFRKLLDNSIFMLAFWNTLRFLAVALPLILLTSYAIALLLKNQVRQHRMLKSVILMPFIMPVIGTVILVELLFTEAGVTNQVLFTMGLPIVDWLDTEFAFGVVVLLYLWKNMGYAVILLLAGLITIPEDHYAAASLDGATPVQQFRHITMPQMWYSVFFTLVFSLINAFKCFREIFLIGGTHPDDSIYMLQHFINNCFENLNYPKLAVASVLLMLLLSAVFMVCYRWVLRKEAFRG